jgi:hypothetical protein
MPVSWHFLRSVLFVLHGQPDTGWSLCDVRPLGCAECCVKMAVFGPANISNNDFRTLMQNCYIWIAHT